MAADSASAAATKPRRARGPLRVLLCDSLPTGLGGGFRFDRKEEALRRRLAPYLQSGALELHVEPAVDVARLDALLYRHRPDVFHLVCHGVGATLELEDRHGQRRSLSAPELARMYRACGPYRPGLTILEACHSLAVASALCDPFLEGIAPWAIGVRDRIDPAVSTIFFASLYHTVSAGATIAEAFAGARRDLELLVPAIPSVPVLCAHPTETDDRPLFDGALWLGRGIHASARDDRVFRAPALVATDGPVFGRADELTALRDAWTHQAAPVLQLRGGAGIGKSALLRCWLDDLADDGWPGASRVFAWTFDPTARGPGVGDVHAFLDHALDFFGDRDRDRTRNDPIREVWSRGLRLGRVLRREPFLLLLDDAPLLPRASDDANECSPEAMLHPGLAGLLRELGGAREGLCVLSTRDDAPWLALADSVARLELTGLDPEAAADLLWSAGLVDTTETLSALAETLGRHPLALQVAARAFTGGQEALDAVSRASPTLAPLQRLLATLPDLDPLASRALTLLALRRGGADLTVLGEHDPHALHGAMRALVRRGLATSDRTRESPTGTLTHRALAEAWLALAQHDLASWAPPREPDIAGGDTLDGLHARARAVDMSIQTGNVAAALRIYVEEIACHDPETQQWSHIARKLGAIAEDLDILSRFVARDERGRARWAILRDDLAAHPDIAPARRAYVLHRIALALRHLGRVHEARPPLLAALRVYEAMDAHERAAICANDLAELDVLLGDLDSALEQAETAWKCAQDSGDDTALQLCQATLGHVLHLLGDLGAAAAAFEAAEAHTARLARSREQFMTPVLCSRPGYQHWLLLLDQLESTPDHEPATVADRIEHLRVRLAYAADFDQREHVAGVSRGLTYLARGRLATLCALRRWPGPSFDTSPDPGSRALVDFAQAIAVFRAHQHVWMLPPALLARARLHRTVLGDPVAARLDLDEARALSDGLGSPPLQSACVSEEEALSRGTASSAPHSGRPTSR